MEQISVIALLSLLKLEAISVSLQIKRTFLMWLTPIILFFMKMVCLSSGIGSRGNGISSPFNFLYATSYDEGETTDTDDESSACSPSCENVLVI